MQPSANSHHHLSARHRFVMRVGLTALLLALGLASFNFFLGVYDKYRQFDPAAYTMYWTRREWLWLHLAGGALAIALGPVQLFTQWLRNHPRVHRWSGRTYVTGILVACVGAAALIATSPAPFEIRMAFSAIMLAWLTTLLAGIVAVRGGRVRQHRHWMVLNYIVTLSPVTFRALLEIPEVMQLASPPMVISVLLWVSWLLPSMVVGAIHWVVDRGVAA